MVNDDDDEVDKDKLSTAAADSTADGDDKE